MKFEKPEALPIFAFKSRYYSYAFFMLGFYLILATATALGWIGGDYAIANADLTYLPPSFENLLGTDLFGRSLLHRNLHAMKIAVLIGFFSSAIAMVIGVTLGALSGYFGGWVDRIIRWVYTSIDSVPYILLISGLTFSLGQGLYNVFIVLGATGWVKLCRLIRTEFLKEKELPYIQAANTLGYSSFRKVFHHILPNCFHIAIVQFGIFFVYAIKIEVVLSFIGLGVELGTPSWGTMLADARAELPRGIWWNFAAISTLMFFLVLSANLALDYFRQKLSNTGANAQ